MSSTNQQDDRVSNGPLYLIVDWVIVTFQLVSPIEWKKRAAIKLLRANSVEEKRRIANVAIDVFIASKWSFILTLWALGERHWFFVGAAIFLLIMNLHTYFWYHLWVIETGAPVQGVQFRERRRFVNLIQAVAFSMVTYAYLYHRVLDAGFTWPPKTVPWLAALIFSIGNSLTGFAGDLKPESSIAQAVTVSQLLMTFVFVAMLLSNSVPRPRT